MHTLRLARIAPVRVQAARLAALVLPTPVAALRLLGVTAVAHALATSRQLGGVLRLHTSSVAQQAESSATAATDASAACPCAASCACSAPPPPCPQHGSYPSDVVSSIDWVEPLERSLPKAPHKQLVLCTGAGPESWTADVGSDPKSFAHELSAQLKAAKLPFKAPLIAGDWPTLDEHDSTRALSAEEASRRDTFDVLLFPDSIRIRSVKRADIGQLVQALAQHVEAQRAGATSSAAAISFPLPHSPLKGTTFLLCSHMARDRRCGVAGPMLADALKRNLDASQQHSSDSQQQPQPTASILRVSHVGGHKFAGNVIVHPAGVWYGRVLPCHVPSLLLAHVPGFRPADTDGSRRTVSDSQTMEEEQRKLAPLVRGHLKSL